MAAAVFISNERGSTEIAIDARSNQEVSLVGRLFPGAVPVKIVSRVIAGVKVVRIVGMTKIVAGEVL